MIDPVGELRRVDGGADDESAASAVSSLARALDVSALVVLRPHLREVVADAAWFDEEWRQASATVSGLSSDDLCVVAPSLATARGAAAVGVEGPLPWVAGRGASRTLILGVSGDRARALQPALGPLAFAVELMIEGFERDVTDRRNAVLKERARIASQIHQGASQELATISVQLEILQELLERDPLRGRELVSEIRSSARHALISLRAALFDLTPAVPDSTWLTEGLKRLVANFAQDWGAAIDFSCEGEAKSIAADVLGLVFTFVTEGLINLRKHSLSRRGHVRVAFDKEALLANVQDDAPPPREWGVAELPGHGLNILWGRARLLGGDLRVEPINSSGTQVTLEIPI